MAVGKTDTWFPMYPADYLKDTLDLTLEEDGFYTRALNQVYINKGRIPVEPERLQRLLRVNRVQYNRCKWILGKYFYQAANGYGNRRADEEIAKAAERSVVAAEKGKKGNEKRWAGRRSSDRTSEAAAIPGRSLGGRSSQSQYPPYTPPDEKSPPSDPPEFQTVFPALCAAIGIATPSWRDEEAAHGAWHELKAKGETVEEFAARAARYREKWPNLPCTFNAVMKNWHTMAPPKKADPLVPVVEFLPDSLLPEGPNG